MALERDRVRQAIAAAHRSGSEYVSLHGVQEALKGTVNANTVSGQIHYMHRVSGELETAPSKLPLGHGQRPVTAYRLGTITELSPPEASQTGVEVHVPSGWRRFDRVNAFSIDAGTLRLMDLGEAPGNALRELIAVFPPGGWHGLLSGRAREIPAAVTG